MDKFEALQSIVAKREEIRQEMDKIKREMLAETDRAYSFFLVAEIEELYKKVQELDAEVDRLIAEM